MVEALAFILGALAWTFPSLGWCFTPPPRASYVSEATEALRDAEKLLSTSNHEMSLRLAERACGLLERTLEPGAFRLAHCLGYLGVLYLEGGVYKHAESALTRSRAMLEGRLPPGHPCVGKRGSPRSVEAHDAIRAPLESIEPVYYRLLSIREMESGFVPDHPHGGFKVHEGHRAQGLIVCASVASVLGSLARLHREQAHHVEARDALASSLRIREAILLKEHPHHIFGHHELAKIHLAVGRYEQAKELFSRALDATKERLGPTHPHVPANLIGLAAVHTYQARYELAESELLSALEILERPGLFHSSLARQAEALRQLAIVYARQGRSFEESSRLFRRALSVQEWIHGSVHPEVARTLTELALLQMKGGHLHDAKGLLDRALEIYISLLGAEHPEVARPLTVLGTLQSVQGQHDAAERSLGRAWGILEASVGSRHPFAISVLDALAQVERARGDYDKGIALLEKARMSYKECHGVGTRISDLKPPWSCTGLSREPRARLHDRTLAMAYWEMKRYEEAKGIEDGLTGIDLALFSLEHGRHRARQKRDDTIRLEAEQEALAWFLLALQREESKLVGTLAFSPDSERIAYTTAIAATTDPIISYHLQGAPDDRIVAEIALVTILNRKGRTQDIIGRSVGWIRTLNTDGHERLLNELLENRVRYAALARAVAGTRSDERVGYELAQSKRREAEIRKMFSGLARSIERVTPRQREVLSGKTRKLERYGSRVLLPRDIQQVLPHGTAMIEFVKYTARVGVAARVEKATAEERYAAYILSATGFDWADLGPARPIEDQLAKFRIALATQRDDVLERAQATHALVMAPILERTGDANALIIAPDDALNLIPFGALHDGREYLVKRISLHYVTTARDLLRPLDVSQTGESSVVVVANPQGSALPGTEREAEIIAGLYEHAEVLTGDVATKSRLLQHAHPRLLHIASHGFFSPTPSLYDDASASKSIDSPSSMVPAFVRAASNAMLESGLFLAPDPAHPEDPARGAPLTAYEVSAWDLRGTELVVLSACDTGLGLVSAGEGVFGLRRAFMLAGAETQAMSLWPVIDDVGALLMETYYRNLAAGWGRTEAMQQAQLEFLAEPATSHPHYWASYVVVGEQAPLTLRPTRDRPPRLEPPARGCRAAVVAPQQYGGAVILWLMVAGSLMRRRAI